MASNQNADDYHAQACDRERDNGSEWLARKRDEAVMQSISRKPLALRVPPSFTPLQWDKHVHGLNNQLAPTSANFENSEIAFLMRD